MAGRASSPAVGVMCNPDSVPALDSVSRPGALHGVAVAQACPSEPWWPAVPCRWGQPPSAVCSPFIPRATGLTDLWAWGARLLDAGLL